MEKEVMSFFHNAFCNRLREIKSEMESHGGVFRDSQMIDDTNDCIRGIKNLQKIKAMEEKPTTAKTTML